MKFLIFLGVLCVAVAWNEEGQYFCGSFGPLQEAVSTPSQLLYHHFRSPGLYFNHPYARGCDPAELWLQTESGTYYSHKFEYNGAAAVPGRQWTNFDVMSSTREIAFNGKRRTFSIEYTDPAGPWTFGSNRYLKSVVISCDVSQDESANETFSFVVNNRGQTLTSTHVVPPNCHENNPGFQEFVSWTYPSPTDIYPSRRERNGVVTDIFYENWPYSDTLGEFTIVEKTGNTVVRNRYLTTTCQAEKEHLPNWKWNRVTRKEVTTIQIWNELTTPSPDVVVIPNTTSSYVIRYDYDLNYRLKAVYTSEGVNQIVDSERVHWVGNELHARNVFSDTSERLVVHREPLAAGQLLNFKAWNQRAADAIPTVLNFFVLRPIGNQFTHRMIYLSETFSVPTLNNAGQNVTTYNVPAPPLMVQDGDLIGFYGKGIPYSEGDDVVYSLSGNNIKSVSEGDIKLGQFPITFVSSRNYAFGATVNITLTPSEDIFLYDGVPEHSRKIWGMTYAGDAKGSLTSLFVAPNPDPVFTRPQPFFPYGEHTFIVRDGSTVMPEDQDPVAEKLKVTNVCRGTWTVENYNPVAVTIKHSWHQRVDYAEEKTIGPNGKIWIFSGSAKDFNMWFVKGLTHTLVGRWFPQTDGSKCLKLVPECSGRWHLRNLINTEVEYNFVSVGAMGKTTGLGRIPPRESVVLNTKGGDEILSLYLERNIREARKRGDTNNCTAMPIQYNPNA